MSGDQLAGLTAVISQDTQAPNHHGAHPKLIYTDYFSIKIHIYTQEHQSSKSLHSDTILNGVT